MKNDIYKCALLALSLVLALVTKITARLTANSSQIFALQSRHASRHPSSWTSRKMIIDIEEDYPLGKVDGLAVCYVLKSETMWSFESVADGSTAEQHFREALSADGVHRGLVDGGPSAVAWIAKCNGEDDWMSIKPTKGAEIYAKNYFE